MGTCPPPARVTAAARRRTNSQRTEDPSGNATAGLRRAAPGEGHRGRPVGGRSSGAAYAGSSVVLGDGALPPVSNRTGLGVLNEIFDKA